MKVILDIRMVVNCEPLQPTSNLAERIQQAIQDELNRWAEQGGIFAMLETGSEVYIEAADVLMDPEVNKTEE